MSLRERLCLNVSPLLIRMALAAVFVWAGAGKLFYSDEVTGEDAAILATLGVIPPPTTPTTPTTPTPATTPTTSTPPTTPPPPTTGASTTAATDGTDPSGGVTFRLTEGGEGVEGTAPTTVAEGPRYRAEEFPGSTAVSRRHLISLVLYKASRPDGQGRRLWPGGLASPLMIRSLAWIAVLTEFVGGFLVLVGFLTRLSALGLAVTMVVAMLLTTIGPAVLSGDGFLGFLPQPRMRDSAAWGMAWMPLLWQWVMLMGALAIVLGGPGGMSLDRLIFGAPGRRGGERTESEEEDEED